MLAPLILHLLQYHSVAPPVCFGGISESRSTISDDLTTLFLHVLHPIYHQHSSSWTAQMVPRIIEWTPYINNLTKNGYVYFFLNFMFYRINYGVVMCCVGRTFATSSRSAMFLMLDLTTKSSFVLFLEATEIRDVALSDLSFPLLSAKLHIKF